MSSILSSITEELFTEVMKGVGGDFVTDARQIVEILGQSKINGTAVALTSPAWGSGFFITAVQDIFLGEEDGDVLIVFKPYDITGYIFPRNKLYLWEIQSVCAFKSAFENPYIKTITPLNP
jgi:hypothetical protein